MNQDSVDQLFDRIREGVGLTFNQTSLSSLGLAVIVLLGLAVLTLPRRYALLPLLVGACFIPAGQRIAVFTLDFTLLRIMVLFGWARIILKKDNRDFHWKTIDVLIIAWVLSRSAAYILLHGTMSAVIYRLGGMFDALGMYFLFRMLIEDWDDAYRIVKVFIILSIPVAFFFLIENGTGRNLFSIFGGVPEAARIRGDDLRCQGAFVHPIAAGCFWASLMPVMLFFLWRSGKEKILAIAGLCCSALIILFCASSTPVVAALAGLGAACLFPARRLMKWIRWGALCSIVGLHLVMDGPVWALIAKTDIVGGSTGYHRYQLIQQAITRIDEWWLIGTTTTAHWGHFLFDVANNYVSEGVRGGLIALVFFLAIIGFAFLGIGRSLRLNSGDSMKTLFAWLLGGMVFAHCTSFIALNYSEQNTMIWFLTLAIVGRLTPLVVKEEALVEQGPFALGREAELVNRKGLLR